MLVLLPALQTKKPVRKGFLSAELLRGRSAGSRCAQAASTRKISLFPFTLLQVLVALFHFQTAYLFWGRKRPDSRERQAGGQSKGHPLTCRDALDFILRLGNLEKFKVENDMSQSQCPPPPPATRVWLPCVLLVYAHQKPDSSFRGTVTFRHLKYFSFSLFFFF